MFAHDLILARHGQTEWNATSRMQGRMNAPLTAQGRRDAEALGALLAPLDLDAYDLRISPQGRVVQTAAIALGHRHKPLRSDDRLMEIDIGAWSGQLLDTVRAERPDLFTDDPAKRFRWYEEAPGGEGVPALEARCRSLLEDLTGPAILLTHGIALRMLRSLALRGDSSLFGMDGRTRQGIAYMCRRGQLFEIEQAGDFPA